MAAAGVKHGMQTGEMHVPQNRCLALLYMFGPEGTWIKGLVAEKSQGMRTMPELTRGGSGKEIQRQWRVSNRKDCPDQHHA
jgi:hypothetical protein